MSYNLTEEQEIARAVASKVNTDFVDAGMVSGESFFEAQKAYNNTLKQRAIRFLKDLDKKIDALSNQEIADLLRVLIAGGLHIENEEELEYYIALLERIALSRLTQLIEQINTDPNAQLPDQKGFLELIDALKIAHLRKQPKDKNSPEFLKWQKMMQNFDQAKKIIKKNTKTKQPQRSSRQGGSREEQNSGDDKSRDELIGKMTSAGVPPYGPYWNDVLAGFEGADNKADFVASWTVDEQRRDQEKERSKSEKKPEKTDQEKIDELRMGQRQQNEEKIDSEFQNPSNAKTAKQAADKKLDKTGQTITDKDIAAIKTKIISGR